MKGVNLLLIVIAVVVCTFAGNAMAVLFDFEEVPNASGPAVIEVYMEDLYGSDITVANGRVRLGRIPGPLGPDRYVRAGYPYGAHWFSISFNEIPITSVSFDWATASDTFHAFADDTEFFSHGGGLWSSGDSGTVFFDSPVTTLKFANSPCVEIRVDNLSVTQVPEPAAVYLLGLGGLILLRKRRA